jgi:hypothetical protein
MMNHYWTDRDHLATRQAEIEDWLDDLVEFPTGAIEGAIITWRRNERRRPTPADIRRLILPDPPREVEAGAAYAPFAPSRLSLAQLQKHRAATAPLWDLVRRAKEGEDPDMLIAERRRMSEEMLERDPELRRINERIKSS